MKAQSVDSLIQQHEAQAQLLVNSKQNGFIPELQKALYALIKISDKGPKDTGNYFSVLSIIYTLVEEGRLKELFYKLSICFPEYYSLPDAEKEATLGILEDMKVGFENGSTIQQLFN